MIPGAQHRLLLMGDSYTGAAMARQALQHSCDELLELAGAATHILLTIPPVAASLYDPVLHAQKDLIIRHCRHLKWLGYLSSTGVYGNADGAWVDEDTPPRPSSARGLVRWEHERQWLALAEREGLPLHTFRLGGIYGPGRSALNAVGRGAESSSQQRRGRQRFTARVHVHDIACALMASAAAPAPGTLLNVVDDLPAPRSEVVGFAASLLGVAVACSAAGDRPERDSGAEAAAGDEGPGGRLRSQPPLEEKRVRNERMKQRLGVRLRYPTYKEGLTAIHRGDTSPFHTADVLRLRAATAAAAAR